MLMADCLAGPAEVAGTQGQWHRAARLFGATEALCERLQVPAPVIYRRAYDQAISTVRAQLDEALAAAWAEGRALALEQAITYALAGAARHTVDEP